MKDQRTRHIWAVGRNYVDHAKEMNAELPKTPLFFLKAGGCLVQASSHLEPNSISLPTWSTNIHHELEIALKLTSVSGGLEFTEMALALDLTERDFQAVAKKNGEPWTVSKSFTGSCPVSTWIPFNPKSVYSFQLTVNGTVRQRGSTAQMIFPATTLLSFANAHFPTENGDILLTGTPAGVAPIQRGDRLEAQLFTTDSSTAATSTNSPILTCHWIVS